MDGFTFITAKKVMKAIISTTLPYGSSPVRIR